MSIRKGGQVNPKYKWQQWKGFKKLHAVEWWSRIDNYISACGISQPDCAFMEPPNTKLITTPMRWEIKKGIN